MLKNSLKYRFEAQNAGTGDTFEIRTQRAAHGVNATDVLLITGKIARKLFSAGVQEKKNIF